MYRSSTIAILPGKGDGPFEAPIQVGLPSNGADSFQLLTGDFNGDGKTDLAVADSYSDIITILLGNGDGTFTTSGTVHSGARNVQLQQLISTGMANSISQRRRVV